MNSRLQSNTIALLGVGHTNAHIVRMWRMKPIPDCRLVCVSNFPYVTYSGMLPGVLSGQYERDQMEIDLVRLCSSVGARLIIDDVAELDVANRQIKFADRSPLNYDLLSIGIGSEPVTGDVEIAANANLVKIKPMQTFLDRLHLAIDQAKVLAGDQPVQVFVVGGGVGGIEVTFCLNKRLHDELGHGNFQLHVVNAADFLGTGLKEKTQKIIAAEMEKAQVKTHTSVRISAVNQTSIEMGDGETHECHLVLWATNAKASPLLSNIDLPHDDKGFLLTKPTLQSTGDDAVFVVGDSGTMQTDPTPKAGVFAVRQAPVLWRNFQNSISKQPLEAYKPQRGFLKLLNLADGRAIGEYKGFTFANRMMWKLKDRIDVKFMEKYQQYEPMEMTMTPDAEEAKAAMRCVGCGGKIGGSVLSRVLKDLQVQPHDDVIIGLDKPDDAAILRTESGQVTLTTDFFAAPYDDPWIIGRLATLNSASDAFAMGAQPTAALANIQVSYGKPRRQQQELFELLSGAMYEFKKMGATIAGGHTIEGPRLTAGFTVAAKQLFDPAQKGDLNVGDSLILTKPIGSGVLLAALMQSLCSGRDFQSLESQMVLSNQIALELLGHDNVSAITDVTGFGFAGHLLEMLRASQVSATIELDKIAIYDGVKSLSESLKIESTLAEQNREIENQMSASHEASQRFEYETLFDPQTCGGLLFGASGNVDPLLNLLKEQGFLYASVVGKVTAEMPIDEIQRLKVV